MKLWAKVLIGLGLGVIAGLILGPTAVYLKPIGSIFLSLINMIIVPLVLASITVGVTSIHDPKKLGRIGLKTLALYLITTVAAIMIGLAFAEFFQVGKGVALQAEQVTGIVSTPTPTIGDILISVVPSNPFVSMVNGNILQIIVFALFFGIAINFAGEKGIPVMKFMESLADVMYRLTSIIMEFSPIEYIKENDQLPPFLVMSARFDMGLEVDAKRFVEKFRQYNYPVEYYTIGGITTHGTIASKFSKNDAHRHFFTFIRQNIK